MEVASLHFEGFLEWPAVQHYDATLSVCSQRLTSGILGSESLCGVNRTFCRDRGPVGVDALLTGAAVAMPAPWVGLGSCTIWRGVSAGPSSHSSRAVIRGARPLNCGSLTGNVDMSQHGSQRHGESEGAKSCEHLASCEGKDPKRPADVFLAPPAAAAEQELQFPGREVWTQQQQHNIQPN